MYPSKPPSFQCFGLLVGLRWHPQRMRLARLAWLMTTICCLVAAAIVLVRGDRGYAAVAFAVALSAAINLVR